MSAEVGILVAIIALALIVRLIWVFYTDWRPLPDDDAYRYDFAAQALADGRGYIHLDGSPTAFWPPGYPLLLATVYTVFGESLRAAQLLNVVLGAATVALVYIIGRRVFSPTAGLVAAALVALFPSLIFFTGVTLSEIAFTFLALSAMAVVLRESSSPFNAPWLLAAGLILGFAALVRGQALLLPVVFLPFWFLSTGSWPAAGRKMVAVLLGAGLIVAPWTIRNAIELDSPVLISTNAGVDFWIGHHEGTRGALTSGDELVFRHPELTVQEREVRINREGFQDGLSFAAHHPATELVLPFRKLFWLYYNDEEGLKWNEGHGGQPWLGRTQRDGLLALSNVYYYAVVSLAIIGLPLWARREPGRVLILSVIAYWTLVHLAFFGDPRFHAPIMPLVSLLAAAPIAEFLNRRLLADRIEAKATP